MTEKEEKSLAFVARYFKEGRLNKEKANRLFCKTTGYGQHTLRLKAWRIAAAILLVASITFAAITIVHRQSKLLPTPSKVIMDTTSTQQALPDSTQSVTFHFNRTPVNRVLDEVGEHYGAKLEASDTTKTVSGAIEVSSLQEATNILETTLNIKIKVIR